MRKRVTVELALAEPVAVPVTNRNLPQMVARLNAVEQLQHVQLFSGGHKVALHPGQFVSLQ